MSCIRRLRSKAAGFPVYYEARLDRERNEKMPLRKREHFSLRAMYKERIGGNVPVFPMCLEELIPGGSCVAG